MVSPDLNSCLTSISILLFELFWFSHVKNQEVQKGPQGLPVSDPLPTDLFNVFHFHLLFKVLNFTPSVVSIQCDILVSGVQYSESEVLWTAQCSSWGVPTLIPFTYFLHPPPTSLQATTSLFSVLRVSLSGIWVAQAP